MHPLAPEEAAALVQNGIPIEQLPRFSRTHTDPAVAFNLWPKGTIIRCERFLGDGVGFRVVL
jgi:hypothetical protein